MTRIQERLMTQIDTEYQKFHARIVPNIPAATILGIRTPILRKLAKELRGTDEAAAFLQELPHTYYEENQLHSFLISLEKDMDAALAEVNRFLPYVDNWATCDQLSPTVFRKYAERLLPDITRWLNSSETYTIRFGIEMLMNHFLDERFSPAYLEMVAKVQSEEYYVNMMSAWYFATALAKQWEATVPYLQEQKLSSWVHQKTIQKAIESNRISDEQKTYLRTLRLK